MTFSSERHESVTIVPSKSLDDRQFFFRDKLVGAPVPVPRRETIDLIGKQLAKIDLYTFVWDANPVVSSIYL